MQGKWSLSNWLLSEVWPSLLLPSSRGVTSGDSTNYPSNHVQHSQLSKLADVLSFEYVAKSKNKDLGGAWKAALQAAIGVITWRDVGETHGRDSTFGKGKKSHQNNRSCLSRHVDVYRSIEVPLSLAYAHTLSFFLEHFFTEANLLCFPAVMALSGVMMPPLENLHSNLLPAQLDKAEDDTLGKEDFLEEGVGVVGTSPVPAFIRDGQHTLGKVVVEPKTGFQFPTILCTDALTSQNLDTSMQILAGVGLKSVTIVKLKSIKIYAFGLYIRPDFFKAHFSEKYSAVPPEELKHDPCFYEDLLRFDLGLTVRLMVHYKALKMGMVRSAFDSSLRNRLKKIKGVEDDEGLKIFNSYFSQNLLLPRGTIIDFRWLPGGQFRTEIDGQLLGTIHSHDFCSKFSNSTAECTYLPVL
eukprot:c22427_g1_i1 orf=365-1597(-)